MRKIIILRPGALGDVLAIRGTIRLVRSVLPGADICLAAPGERGALFHRAGWADRWYDWDRSAFSWLFSHGHDAPPPALSAVFGGCDLLLSYAGHSSHHEYDHVLEHRIAELAPAASTVFCPSRPPDGHDQAIGEWLAQAAGAFCQTFGLVETDARIDYPGLAASRLVFPRLPETALGITGAYAVIHPGSGSQTKNWPLDNFIGLGRRMRDFSNKTLSLIVTSGEADGEAGQILEDALGARHIHQPSLPQLAGILANARLYIGNDSGVSHLAAAVETAQGARPAVAVVFGPSNPAVWSPPGALVLNAGPGLDELPTETAWRKIRKSVETVLE